MCKAMTVEILPDGSIVSIYDDAVLPLAERLGVTPRVSRASHVEPTGGMWQVDMSPVGGPACLGFFRTRDEALKAEVAWLKQHGLAEGAKALGLM